MAEREPEASGFRKVSTEHYKACPTGNRNRSSKPKWPAFTVEIRGDQKKHQSQKEKTGPVSQRMAERSGEFRMSTT
jgi:hypothetical protein